MTEFWFPIFLAVILVLVLVFSIIAIRRGDDGGPGAGCSCVLLIFLLIVWFGYYTSSIGEIADMRAFIDATKSAYEYTITSTQEVEIKAVSSAEPSAYEILDAGCYSNLS